MAGDRCAGPRDSMIAQGLDAPSARPLPNDRMVGMSEEAPPQDHLEHRDQGEGVAAEPRLIDERSHPGFRELFGRLARRAIGVDVALTHLRLSTIDLSERELANVERLRLL